MTDQQYYTTEDFRLLSNGKRLSYLDTLTIMAQRRGMRHTHEEWAAVRTELPLMTEDRAEVLVRQIKSAAAARYWNWFSTEEVLQ